MFNKLGRAGGGGRGGGGNGKRSFPPTVRPVGPGSAKPRSSVGPSAAATAARRGGGGQGPGGGEGHVAEETFTMDSGGPLDFASIIRLTPDLVEEIRRAEERGGAVRIKFDSNSNDSSANVIDVDGKEFRFTWSKDSGVLCDIYEECRTGETGNGLLTERGSAWRKLNVLRNLDESVKNHVKMRSEEAERQLKARRAIVLEPTNPSVKNQSSAAVEGSMRWTHWKPKKEPPYKKQKVEITQAPKFRQSMPLHKSRTSPSIATKVGQSSSPGLSPPEKIALRTSASPILSGTLPTADIVTPFASKEENAASSYEKEAEDRADQVFQKKIRQQTGVNSRPMELRSMLITLLTENPKGITLKAIEKAVREALPNSTKKIEIALKNVANFVAPGRYFLKPGVGIESTNAPQAENGNSPVLAGEGAMIVDAMEKTGFSPLDQRHNSILEHPQKSDAIEKTGIHDIVGDPFTNDGKIENETEMQAETSSESGSDSESESDSSDSGSDSESQSRSRSKSKSPIASRSGSTSDSDSDASSSSKETNVDIDVDVDVDVDITTSDDEKNDAKSILLAANLKAFSSPRICATYDGQCNQDRDVEVDRVSSQDPNSFIVEIDDNMPHAIEDAKNNPIYSNANLSDEEKFLQSNQRNNSEPDHVISDYRQPDISQSTTKVTSKKSSKINNFEENIGNSRRPKTSMAFPSTGNRIGSNFTENPSHILSDKSEENQHKDPVMASDMFQDSSTINNLHIDCENAVPGRRMPYGNLNKKRPSPAFQKFSHVDAREPRHSPGDLVARRKYSVSSEKIDRSFENFGRDIKHSERIFGHPDESDAPTTRNTPPIEKISMPKDKHHQGIQNEDTYSAGKSTAKRKRINVPEERLPSLPDSHYRKCIEKNKIHKDTGQMDHMRRPEVDNLPGADVVKGGALNRCLSELEVGEFREPLSMEDMQGSEGQPEQKASPCTINDANAMGDLNLDTSKGRTLGKSNSGSRRASPSIVEVRNRKGQDGFQRPVAEGMSETSRPQQWSQQFPRSSRINSEPVSDFDSRSNHLFDAENHTGVYKKNQGRFPDGNKAITESRDSADQRKRNFKRNGYSNGGKGMDSSPDEDFIFPKFEKDEPELKGPIIDFSQYKEYVQEYKEKYECYIGLKNQLEKIQNEFLKICCDLPELSKRRDTGHYNDCYRRARNFHCQHKMRFARLKKTFTVIYEELANIKHRIKIFAEEYTKG